MSEFKKFDSAKPRYELIPPVALLEIANVFTHGAVKYDDYNWAKCKDPQRYIGAIERHMKKLQAGEHFDPDSGCHHLASVATSAIMLMDLILRDEIKQHEVCPLQTPDGVRLAQAYQAGLRRTKTAITLGKTAREAHEKGSG